MTNNPRTYPRQGGQLNAISAREKRERTWMPSGMNARPRSSTSISVPTFGEEGDRSAVACATRITALNISFISGPEQLPYSTNMRSACRDVRDRAYVHASHPAVVAAAITGDTAIRRGEWNASALPPRLPSLCFLHLLPFCRPSHSFFFSLPSFSPFLISLFAHRFSAARLTFCVPTEMTAKGEHPADRVSREINLSGISRNERMLFHLDATLVSLVEDRDDASWRKSSVCVRIWWTEDCSVNEQAIRNSEFTCCEFQ